MPADRPVTNHQSSEAIGKASARPMTETDAPTSGPRRRPRRTRWAGRETPPPTRETSRRRTRDSPTLIATVSATSRSESTAAVERSKLER